MQGNIFIRFLSRAGLAVLAVMIAFPALADDKEAPSGKLSLPRKNMKKFREQDVILRY